MLGTLSHSVLSGPFNAILYHFEPPGSFLAVWVNLVPLSHSDTWAILGPMGHVGLLGHIRPPWPFWNICIILGLWAILGHLGPTWTFRDLLAILGPISPEIKYVAS